MASDSTLDPAWSAFLFPHSYAKEGEIRRLLSFFDQVTIPQPWHMEDRFSAPYENVRVLRPPERFRPVEGFRALLSQYKDWMRHTSGGTLSAMSAIRRYGSEEPSTWNIRRAIRNAEIKGDSPEFSATKWHLLLHLARETEESRREAGEVLKKLKGGGGPLRGVVEEEQESLMEDLRQFDDDLEMGEPFLEWVFEAWFGLFEGILDPGGLLVTTVPRVAACLSDLWDEFCPQEDGSHKLRFEWPDLSDFDPEELTGERRRILEKRLWKRLRDLTLEYCEDPAGRFEQVKGAIEEICRTGVGGEKRITITVRSFPLCSGANAGRNRTFLRSLSGKSLFLIEGGSR
jgi:hypothetical protein